MFPRGARAVQELSTVQGSGFRVQGSGFGAYGSDLKGDDAASRGSAIARPVDHLHLAHGPAPREVLERRRVLRLCRARRCSKRGLNPQTLNQKPRRACRVGFEGHHPRRIRPYQTQPDGACRTRVVVLSDNTVVAHTVSKRDGIEQRSVCTESGVGVGVWRSGFEAQG